MPSAFQFLASAAVRILRSFARSATSRSTSRLPAGAEKTGPCNAKEMQFEEVPLAGVNTALPKTRGLIGMDLSCGYSINAPDVVAEDFSGQTVILNLGNGHYFSLQGIASPIWALLLAGHAPKDVLGSIEKSRQDMVAESARFIERLLELSLLVPRAGAAGPSGPIVASWDGASPQIDVFDDLAELIFADPIHDVDEQAGWPTPRQNP